MRIAINKRTIESSIVALALVVISCAAYITNTQKMAKYEPEIMGYRTAGVVSAVYTIETDAYENVVVTEADIQQVSEELEAAQKAEEAQAELEKELATWETRLMADVNEYLYVRSEPSKDGKVLGKLRKGDVAVVMDETGDWYQISSGNLEGYVSADYSVVGDEALAYAHENCTIYATSLEKGLRVRSEADTESAVYKTMGKGDRIEVDVEENDVDGWVAVKYAGKTGYVKEEFVKVGLDLGEGITVEEEKKALEEAKAMAKQTTQITTEQKAAVTATYDDVTILGALIQLESGHECYEGQVAVGAVCMNRLRSGRYGGNIADVIYAKGQFPATAKRVASVAANGVKPSCLQAAQEAFNGVDNTGGATHFITIRSGHGGLVIGNHVFY